MIIQSNKEIKIFYNHFVAEELNEDGSPKYQPPTPPHKIDSEVDSFVLSKSFIPKELHIKMVPDYSVNGDIDNREYFYELHLIDYTITSRNLQFIRMLLKVIADYRAEKIDYDYNIIENYPQMFV